MPVAPMFVSSRGLAVERYGVHRRDEWDRFVAAGKNATFLFDRGYMDYHGDRFVDHSLMLWKADGLVGLLPANLAADGSLCSHQGLTYGGFVFDRDVTLHTALEVVHATLGALSAAGIELLAYKRIPRVYNTLPDDEVDYAMFLVDARLTRRDTAMVVALRDRLPFRANKKSSRAKRDAVRLVEEADFAPFWSRLLLPRLTDRYGVAPVHSLAEIGLLASRFPQHIRQFAAYAGDEIVAGATIYETDTVAHLQYSAMNDAGRHLSAHDTLMEWLILERYKDKHFFDFGTCNESEGRALNHPLLRSKEGFGARACAHDYYYIRTAQSDKLEAALPPRDAPAAAAVH